MFNKNIPTIILCGGIGTRLKEKTEFQPKPMVEIGNEPILWHIMKTYSHHGFDNFILCLGYKGEMIKTYFNKRKENWNVILADTGLETLTGERMKKVIQHINTDYFMVTYGDGVSNIDINKLIDYHIRKNVIGTITGVHPSSKYGLVKTNKGGLVTAFREKPILSDYINGGFMVFKKEFLKYLKEGQTIEEALIDLIRDKNLALYFHDDFWHCMDTYKDYLDLNKMWADNPKWKIWK